VTGQRSDGADLLSGFRCFRAGDQGLIAAPWTPASPSMKTLVSSASCRFSLLNAIGAHWARLTGRPVSWLHVVSFFYDLLGNHGSSRIQLAASLAGRRFAQAMPATTFYPCRPDRDRST
jgi:hypothetical protein